MLLTKNLNKNIDEQYRGIDLNVETMFRYCSLNSINSKEVAEI